MPNQSFEEKLEEIIKKFNVLYSSYEMDGYFLSEYRVFEQISAFIRTALITQREETIKECIEALPKKISENFAKDEIDWKNGWADCLDKAKQSLQSLIKK